MKKKVLIVSDQKADEVLLFILRGVSDAEVVSAPHAQAFAMLGRGIPQVIIVDDYTENGSLARGFQAYHEIKERLLPWQTLVRMGCGDYSYPDYIKRPAKGSASTEERDRFRNTIKSLVDAYTT